MFSRKGEAAADMMKLEPDVGKSKPLTASFHGPKRHDSPLSRHYFRSEVSDRFVRQPLVLVPASDHIVDTRGLSSVENVSSLVLVRIYEIEQCQVIFTFEGVYRIGML